MLDAFDVFSVFCRMPGPAGAGAIPHGVAPVMESKSISANKMHTRRKRALLVFLLVALLGFLIFWSTFEESTVNVKLAWDPSPDPRVNGYKIYYSRSNWEHATVIDVGNRTEYSVSGLDAGVIYSFAATAYSRNGDESSFSNVVKYPSPGR